MPGSVVITGIGAMTPLGSDLRELRRRIEAGESAAAPPTGFDATPFACHWCAEVQHFDPQRYVAEPKLIRLMSREAQLAVAAARLALLDAALSVGTDYPPEAIALFGATGLAGLPRVEVAPLIRASAGPGGQFDPVRFGTSGLKAVSPLLSFKILSNMPACFVSIGENLQGPNAVYTPWEGQGAQAIAAGVRAIRRGEVPCAVVGGSDAKAHELAFLSLEQLGLFEAWKAAATMPRCTGEAAPARAPSGDRGARETSRPGPIPAEGAVYLVLEEAVHATARGARRYARIAESALRSHQQDASRPETEAAVLDALRQGEAVQAILSGDDAPEGNSREAAWARAALGLVPQIVRPKPCAGNLFAAAAALQVALGAVLVERLGGAVLAECFGYGTELAAFRLEPA